MCGKLLFGSINTSRQNHVRMVKESNRILGALEAWNLVIRTNDNLRDLLCLFRMSRNQDSLKSTPDKVVCAGRSSGSVNYLHMI